MVNQFVQYQLVVTFRVKLRVYVLGYEVGGIRLNRSIRELDLALSCVKEWVVVASAKWISISILFPSTYCSSFQFASKGK